jgi:mono/diheme cytochrome c family protein
MVPLVRAWLCGPFLGLVLIAVIQIHFPLFAEDRADGAAAERRDSLGREMPAGQTVSRPASADFRQPLGNVVQLYRRNCQGCHGRDGSGGPARDSMPVIPDFTRHTWQQARTSWRLEVSIREGKGSFMPPFGDRLNEDQAAAMVSLVRTFDRVQAKAAAADPSDFDREFRQLEEEWKRLHRQFKQLEKPTKKP